MRVYQITKFGTVKNKKVMELKNNYALYVPSTIKGEHISDESHAEWCEKYAKIMLENFSGLTVTEAFGYWKNESGKLIAEKVYIIKASTNAEIFEYIYTPDEYIRILAERLKSVMMQEAVSYEINGVLHVI